MLKDILNEITEQSSLWLTEQGIRNPVVRVERSSAPEFGEYCLNVAMRYAKELGKNPIELSEELVSFLIKKNIEGVKDLVAVSPGFVNIYITVAVKVMNLQYILKNKGDFGSNQSLKGETWVVEHTSPNPNKAMHLGHLRLNLIGMSIIRLLAKSSAEVIADAVYNDRGIAIAKLMYGYLAHMKKETDVPTDILYWAEHKDKWYIPNEKNQMPDLFVTECYVLGEKDFKSSAEIEKVIRDLVVEWEKEDQYVWQLWDLVLQFSYDGINRTLKRLDSKWDNIWYEHDHYKKGKYYVEQGLANGLFKKLEDGAVLTNLKADYNLPDTVLLKNDGTSLYITQDIALTDLKKKTYKADHLIWVIGPEQSLAMKQLFAVCEQLEIGKLEEFTHVSYGYVGLKDKEGDFRKMSSREGTAVLIDDVIDTVKSVIVTHLKDDENRNNSEKDILAEKLAVGAVKFAFLKSDRNQSISFDIEQSVDVQGDSGMYVMYSYVRTQSLLRKASSAYGEISFPKLLGMEDEVVRLLLYFPEVVQKATEDLSVHHVAQYLLELSSMFNAWYAREIIVDGTELESYRLAVVESVGITIKNGLALLGIETVIKI